MSDTATDGPSFPLQGFLEMDLSGEPVGRDVARLTIGPEHLNPNGVVHGAVFFALVDTAMGKATMSTVEDGRHCASVELSLRFIRPASAGRLVVDVEVVKRGKTLAHVEGRVHDGDDRLYATGAGTFAILG